MPSFAVLVRQGAHHAWLFITVGATAALSMRRATVRFSWFSTFARRAPYFSRVLIICVGLYVGCQGWARLTLHATLQG